MGDIDTLNSSGFLRQPKYLAQAEQASFWIDLKHLGLDVLVHVAAQAESLEGLHLIAQPGRLFELQGGTRFIHGLLHLLEELIFFAFKHQAQAADLFSVLFLADPEIARRRTLVNAVQDARPEPAPARALVLNVEA